MPTVLVPHEKIPALAARISPEMLSVLRRIHKADFIMNGREVDHDTLRILNQLTELGLVDPVFNGNTEDIPSMWVTNGNGSRVLVYSTGIRGGPYYEVPAAELASWLEQQGPERWWNVDGDPLLTGRLTFPCPAKSLAEHIRMIGRPLLLQAKRDDADAKGQMIGRDRLDTIVDRLGNNSHFTGGGEVPPWSEDRILYLCWKGSTEEWLLAEDNETKVLMESVSDRLALTDSVTFQKIAKPPG